MLDRRTLVVAAAVLTSIMAGCLAGTGGPCTIFEAQWNEPGLYAALPDEPFTDDWTLDKRVSPGFQFSLDEYDEAVGAGDYGVARVVMEVDEGSIELTPTNTITANFDEPVPDDGVRELFVRFATNTTTADQTTISGWADEFLSNKTTPNAGPTQRHIVDIDGPYRLEALYDDVAAEYGPTGVGTAELRFGPWTYFLAMPLKLARADGFRGVHVLAVTGGGHATVSVGVPSQAEADALAETERFFAEQGLGEISAPARAFKSVGSC